MSVCSLRRLPGLGPILVQAQRSSSCKAPWTRASLHGNRGCTRREERGELSATVPARPGAVGPRLRGDDVRGMRGYLCYPSLSSAYPFAATSSHLARYAGALPL